MTTRNRKDNYLKFIIFHIMYTVLKVDVFEHEEKNTQVPPGPSRTLIYSSHYYLGAQPALRRESSPVVGLVPSSDGLAHRFLRSKGPR